MASNSNWQILWLVGFLLLFGLFVTNTHRYVRTLKDNVQIDTVLLTKHDTVRLDSLVYVDKKVIRHDTIRALQVDTLRQVDTVEVELPIEQKVYCDSNYRAVVSGYNPSLDSLDIYQSEKIVTVTKEKIIEPKRTGFTIGTYTGFDGGFSVGLGIMYGIRLW